MFSRLNRLFTPPELDDPEKTREARFLYKILLMSYGMMVVSFIAVIATRSEHLPSLTIVVGSLISFSIIGWLLRNGHIQTAKAYLPTVLWVAVTLLTLFVGGVRGLGFSSYIVIILITYYLFDLRAGLMFFVLSVIASVLILVMELNGDVSTSLGETSISTLVAQILVFLWVAGLLQVSNQNLKETLKRAHDNEHALAKSIQEQQETQTSLETHTRDLERRIVQLQVAAEVARDATSLREVGELLNRAVNLVRDRFGFYHAGIFMVDESGEYAVLRAATGDPGRQMLASGHRLKVGTEGLVGHVTGTGLARVSLNVETDVIHHKNPYLPETRSEMALPLRTGNIVIGVLDVQSKQEAAFDDYDVAILQTMADQLAVAIANASLFEATRRQLEELTILHSVAKAGAESTSQDALIECATQLIGDTLYPDHFGVLLLDETAQVLRFHSSYRGLNDKIKRMAIPLGRGIVGRVAKHGRSLRVTDVTHDVWYINTGRLMRCELCVPLKVGDRVIGVINAESAQRAVFTDADERLLATFANQLATAIERTRLFEISRQRVQELEALRQASLQLSSNLEEQPVLEAIISHAIQLIHADTGHLYLYDGEVLTFGAARTADGSSAAPLDSPRQHGITYTVAREGQRIIIPDVRRHPMFTDRPWEGAIVGLPLRHGHRVIGVMNIAFQGHPHEFDDNELRVLELFTDQASAALVNVQLYAESQERASLLADALVQREELARLESEFIQNVSHELRTPLAIIRGYIELLNDGELGELPAEQANAIGIVNRRVTILNKMVDDLTAILESEAREVKKEPLNLYELTRKVVNDFETQAQLANVQLISHLSPNLPPIKGNGLHLYRVLDNLIGNAIKFTQPGGCVTIRLHNNNNCNIFEVTDTGVGIPAEHLERIFERFYQVDGSATRRYGGTGLGLALVKEITEAHGGVVLVSSTMGQGSTFTVKLPFLNS